MAVAPAKKRLKIPACNQYLSSEKVKNMADSYIMEAQSTAK